MIPRCMDSSGGRATGIACTMQNVDISTNVKIYKQFSCFILLKKQIKKMVMIIFNSVLKR